MSLPRQIAEDLARLEADLQALLATPVAPASSDLEFLLTIGYVRLYKAGNALVWCSGMQIDADGGPHAYHPISSKGLDNLANAGHPGNWWGIATTNGRPSGVPVIQGRNQPALGFYVSTTAMEIPGMERFAETDQRRYVDAETVPFIVLPSGFGMGLKLGDVGLCLNTATGDNSFFCYADIGPAHQIGEGSIALANNLKVPSSPRTGGVAGGIVYLIFPGSTTGQADYGTVSGVADGLVKAWGGLDRLKAMVENL